MLLPDVNVLVYAFRVDTEHHDRDRTWLTTAINGDEPVGVSELVMSSFLRLVTNHRVFVNPSGLVRAIEFCDALLSAPAVVPVRAGERHWARFCGLCRAAGVHGNLVPDAYLAALALDIGATVVTSDAGFRRFPGLRVVTPGG